MSLQATVRLDENVAVVALGGRLTFDDCPQLRQLIDDLIGKQRKDFLFNLRGLQYLDSSGIGELVRSYCAIKRQGGEMKMVYLTPKVEEVLRITNSCFLFEDFPDEESALRSFAEPK